MQRAKEPDRLDAELERPLPANVFWGAHGGRVETYSRSDLEADGNAFVAFAGAFGVRPPSTLGQTGNGDSDGEPHVPSPPSP